MHTKETTIMHINLGVTDFTLIITGVGGTFIFQMV